MLWHYGAIDHYVMVYSRAQVCWCASSLMQRWTTKSNFTQWGECWVRQWEDCKIPEVKWEGLQPWESPKANPQVLWDDQHIHKYSVSQKVTRHHLIIALTFSSHVLDFWNSSRTTRFLALKLRCIIQMWYMYMYAKLKWGMATLGHENSLHSSIHGINVLVNVRDW